MWRITSCAVTSRRGRQARPFRHARCVARLDSRPRRSFAVCHRRDRTSRQSQPPDVMRIGEKLPAPVGKPRRQLYGSAIPARCPGHQSLLCQRGGDGQERQIVRTNDQGKLRAPRHLQGMPEQAETGQSVMACRHQHSPVTPLAGSRCRRPRAPCLRCARRQSGGDGRSRQSGQQPRQYKRRRFSRFAWLPPVEMTWRRD